ncbi:D-2-hydroxyacid dehydrogenase [Sedimentibacter hydroxybenzoicus DSM 7310]|uniref:D-2-hydroxyacid dehydrogenase n=1 Tax=Sedimentibacter hydroxybenzoicus DSM 7310 TaxID=1123245 RepID=A0A974GXV1_SEDHY|nr:D-2-hydroxyacid dehydrogenase [Sedimentibacter hydroxybenzoicus]NYB75938.1 D-2-hydroxyacid dehydrogenase [Sedimentibacter hydroxybenzoicus DSM 7310]
MLRILISDGMENEAVNKLKAMNLDVVERHYETDELMEEIKNFDVLIVRSNTKVKKDIIDAARVTGRLKLIIRGGVGLDNIDVAYAEANGIQVRNTPNASSASVAELVIGQMFNLARFIHNSNITMRQGQWNKKSYEGIEIFNKTLGIIGFGRIGRETANKASALGMNIVYTDVIGEVDNLKYKYLPMDELLKASDFVSVHIPYSGDNAVIGKREIEMMKDGAYIINCARGGVVDEEALLEALDNNKLAGAAIDVFVEEPAKNSPLIKHDRVSCTPHIGASTQEAQTRIGDEIAEIIFNYIKEGA